MGLKTEEILSLLWRKKMIILIFGIVVFFLTLIINIRTPANYTSLATFILNPATLTGGLPIELKRVLSIPVSPEVVNYMIDEFDLVNRYNIDTTQENYREITYYTYLEHTATDHREHINQIAVSVYDKDRFFALKMINKLLLKIDEVNEQFIIDFITYDVQVYDNYIKDVSNKLYSLSKDSSSIGEKLFNDTLLNEKYSQKFLLSYELEILLKERAQLLSKCNKYLKFFERNKPNTIFIMDEPLPQRLPEYPVLNKIIIPSFFMFAGMILFALLLISIEPYKDLLKRTIKF